jgi:hypothetical protein
MTKRSIVRTLVCIMAVLSVNAQQASFDDALKSFKALYYQELWQAGIAGSRFIVYEQAKREASILVFNNNLILPDNTPPY